MTDQRNLTHDNLRLFSGDLERTRHPLARRVIYTQGVKFVAAQQITSLFYGYHLVFKQAPGICIKKPFAKQIVSGLANG